MERLSIACVRLSGGCERMIWWICEAVWCVGRLSGGCGEAV